MTCQTVSDLLPLLDDPELSAEERQAVAAHVAACARCAAELEAVRRAREALRPLRSVALPAGGPERVITAARAARRGVPPAWRRFAAALGSVPAGGWLAAAAVVAFLIVLPLTLLDGQQTQDPGAPAPMQLMSAPADEPARLHGVAYAPAEAVFSAYAEVRTRDVDAFVERVLRVQGQEQPAASSTVSRRADGSAAVLLTGADRAWLDALLERLAAEGAGVILRPGAAALAAADAAADVAAQAAPDLLVLEVMPAHGGESGGAGDGA